MSAWATNMDVLTIDHCAPSVQLILAMVDRVFPEAKSQGQRLKRKECTGLCCGQVSRNGNEV